jgi:hypothetical protein
MTALSGPDGRAAAPALTFTRGINRDLQGRALLGPGRRAPKRGISNHLQRSTMMVMPLTLHY